MEANEHAGRGEGAEPHDRVVLGLVARQRTEWLRQREDEIDAEHRQPQLACKGKKLGNKGKDGAQMLHVREAPPKDVAVLVGRLLEEA